MAKAVRFKVRCTLCDEVFQNDYAEKHTKSKHKGKTFMCLVVRHPYQLSWISLILVRVKWMHFSAQLRLTAQIPVVRKRGKLPLAFTKFSELDQESATDQGESSAQKGKLLSVL